MRAANAEEVRHLRCMRLREVLVPRCVRRTDLPMDIHVLHPQTHLARAGLGRRVVRGSQRVAAETIQQLKQTRLLQRRGSRCRMFQHLMQQIQLRLLDLVPFHPWRCRIHEHVPRLLRWGSPP
jgi:hypothetical protein